MSLITELQKFLGLSWHAAQHAVLGVTGTVVILGSSNGAGTGASTYVSDPSAANGYSSPATSWAGLLSAALGAGWRVINRSLGGTGTTNALARFWTDVAPYRPTHVILCNHQVNDAYDYNAVYANNLKFISYCERIGAVPILRGAYMHNAMTAAQYQGAIALNNALDQLGYHRIDHMSEFDDGAGHWVSSAFHVDGLHPNDAGYRHFFDAIDLGIFYYGAARRPRVRPGLGRWGFSDANGTLGTGMTLANFAGSGNFGSFTAYAKFKSTSASPTLGAAFLSANRPSSNAANAVRIRNSSTVYTATSDGSNVITSAVNSNDQADHSLIIKFNAATQILSLWIDGVLIGTVADARTQEYFNAFSFCGRVDSGAALTTGFTFTDLALWKVPLGSTMIAKLAAGDVPPASLVYFSDLTVEPPAAGSAAMIGNQVQNSVFLSLGGGTLVRA